MFDIDVVREQLRVLSTERLKDHTRMLVRYQTDATTTNSAFVLVPTAWQEPADKRPGAVVLLWPMSGSPRLSSSAML